MIKGISTLFLFQNT